MVFLTQVPQIPQGFPRDSRWDSLRLQLTLSVQEPQHELYALCLGPPAFKEPMKPLDLGELLSHATGAVRSDSKTSWSDDIKVVL